MTRYPAHSIPCRSLLAVASVGLVVGALAETTNPLDSSETTKDRDLADLQMLRDGSILKKVMIPRYDEAKRLSSLLRAGQLTMVNNGLINAETLRVEFFNPDRSLKGQIDLATATLEEQEILRSRGSVSLVSGELVLKGFGLVYSLKKSNGFLRGPANATAIIKTDTSMNLRRKTLQAATGITLMSASALAAPQEKISEEEIGKIESLARPESGRLEDAATKTNEEVSDVLEQEKQLDRTIDEFLTRFEDLEDAAKSAATASSVYEPVPPPPAAEEVSFKTSTLDVQCDEGIFFDNSENFVSFIKNVRVNYPGFKLTNADELKVTFFGPTGGERPDNGEDRDTPDKIGVGEPQAMIATGPVVIDYESEKNGRRVKASARQVIYDFVGETLTLRGGKPWIISDGMTGQITEADGYFRIDTVSGNVQAVGTVRGIYEDRKTGDPLTPDNLEKTNFKTELKPEKPTVFVIGDSISIGYTLPLREKLKGSHNVVRPINEDGTPFNAGNTTRILQHLDKWLATTKPDIVVFNAGLWDIASLDARNPDETSISSESYAENLRKIITRLKQSDAQLFWASTTFVPEGATARDNDNVIEFNSIAEAIMKEEGIEVIDLYESSKDMPLTKRLGSRNVHYMGSGSAILADKVAGQIADEPK